MSISVRRIRSLEAHVADIRQTQSVIQNTLLEIATHLRGGAQFHSRSPSAYPAFAHQSPSTRSLGSPGVTTPSATVSHPPQLMVDTSHPGQPSTSNSNAMAPAHGPMSAALNPSGHRQHRDQMSGPYRSPPLSAAGRPSGQTDLHPLPSSNMMYPPGAPGPSASSSSRSGQPHGPTLPPFSSIESMGPPRSQPTNVSSMRYNSSENAQSSRQLQRPTNGAEAITGSKRVAPSSSNVTSADSSDVEDEDGELPASGLVAPWEVLRGLADVAIQRAAKVRMSP